MLTAHASCSRRCSPRPRAAALVVLAALLGAPEALRAVEPQSSPPAGPPPAVEPDLPLDPPPAAPVDAPPATPPNVSPTVPPEAPPAAPPATEINKPPIQLAAPLLVPVTPEIAPLRLASYEYLAGFGAAAVTVPATMFLGSYLGSRSPNLIASLLPGVLLGIALPPLAVTGAEWLVGRKLAPGRSRFHPAIWAALGVSVVGTVTGSLAGVWTQDTLSMSLFTLAEALLMPAAVTLVMHYTAPRRIAAAPPPAPSPTAAVLPEGRRAEGLPLPSVTLPVVAFAF